MKKIIFLALTALTSTGFSKNIISNSCLEKASINVIDYLTAKDPQSEMHLIKNERDEVVGLSDAERVFPSLDLESIKFTAENEVTVTFRNEDYVITSQLILSKKSNRTQCTVAEVKEFVDSED
jgi:hypothetical protein